MAEPKLDEAQYRRFLDVIQGPIVNIYETDPRLYDPKNTQKKNSPQVRNFDDFNKYLEAVKDKENPQNQDHQGSFVNYNQEHYLSRLSYENFFFDKVENFEQLMLVANGLPDTDCDVDLIYEIITPELLKKLEMTDKQKDTLLGVIKSKAGNQQLPQDLQDSLKTNKTQTPSNLSKNPNSTFHNNKGNEDTKNSMNNTTQPVSEQKRKDP